jgi:hypothetical protein
MSDELEENLKRFFVAGPQYDTYVIPADTILFKSFREPLSKYVARPIPGPAFFGFNEMTSRLYGFAFSYRTTQPYTLLAIDSDKTMQYLLDTVVPTVENKEEIREAMQQSFGYPRKKTPAYGDEKVRIRNSVGPTDWKFVQFLCSQAGIQGYMANFMLEAIPGSRFHPECVICEAPNVVLNADFNVKGYVGLATPEEFHQEIERKLEYSKLNKELQTKRAENKRKASTTSVFGPISRLKLDFGDSDSEDDVKKGGKSRRKLRIKRSLKKKRSLRKKRGLN